MYRGKTHPIIEPACAQVEDGFWLVMANERRARNAKGRPCLRQMCVCMYSTLIEVDNYDEKVMA